MNDSNVLKNSIYTPKNAKISKRIAAWVVDIILIVILWTGISLFTSMVYKYDTYMTTVTEKYVEYNLATYDEEKKEYVFVDIEKDQNAQENYALLIKDQEFVEAYHKVNNGQIIILSTGLFGSLLVFEFIIPLFLKHGRTIGMRFFGIGYVTDEDIDVGFKQVFVRFIFGKFIISGFVPLTGYLLFAMGSGFGGMGLILLVGIPVLNVILSCVTPEKRGIHDYVARVKPIDNDCQIYVKTKEELSRLKIEELTNQNGNLRK